MGILLSESFEWIASRDRVCHVILESLRPLSSSMLSSSHHHYLRNICYELCSSSPLFRPSGHGSLVSHQHPLIRFYAANTDLGFEVGVKVGVPRMNSMPCRSILPHSMSNFESIDQILMDI